MNDNSQKHILNVRAPRSAGKGMISYQISTRTRTSSVPVHRDMYVDIDGIHTRILGFGLDIYQTQVHNHK